MLLLTDGSVIVQELETSQWYRLTPNSQGSYVDGTWSQIASMPGGYAPTWYASAVLPDGRVIVEGGEYNGVSDKQVESTTGVIYNPVTNAWTAVPPPSGSGWSRIGDAPSTVLTNGTFMLGSCCSESEALLNEKTLTWTATGTGKADSNSEEGWSELPNGDVLTVDVNNETSPRNSEIYSPVTGAWTSAGSTPVPLVDTSAAEIGPQLLQPDGNVFAVGATGDNAIYHTASGTWSAGPPLPVIDGQQYDVADGPSAILPDGNVLVDASPGVYDPPSHFFVFNGTSITQVADAPNASESPSYEGLMLVLPTGQVLFNDAGTLETYTDSGAPLASWAPQITSVPSSLTPGVTYTVSGKQLNGLTQGSAFGDDNQSATNYPLVRITNTASGVVSYARTSAMTSMSVAPNATSSASFTLPTGIEQGPSTLVVVANGIPSAPVSVQVGDPSFLYAGVSAGGTGNCSSAANACTLTTALAAAKADVTIELTTSGVEGQTSTYYRGGFSIATSKTAAGSPMTIEPAAGVTRPILDGGGTQRVLTVGDMHLAINGVTIQHGSSPSGGAIANNSGGTVSITDSTISDNNASNGNGGGIDNGDEGSGSLNVSDSTFAGNSAPNGGGGAIDNGDGHNGAGVGHLSVTDSTFSGNDGYDGGAIDNGDNGGTGTAGVTNSTFSANTAGIEGGAIDNGSNSGNGTLTVSHSTFSGNNAISVGGTGTVYNHGTFAVEADIFAGSCEQAGGTWTDYGYNAGSDTSCFKAGTDDTSSAGSNLASLLGPLASHGGPTQTMTLLAGNPAVRIIPNPHGVLCPVLADQRGDAGITGAPCDGGAVQERAPQAILFSGPPLGFVGGTTALSATGGGSGNPVIFSLNASSGSGVCSLSGTDGATINYLANGNCVVDANQAGDSTFSSAPEVQVSFSVVAAFSPVFAARSGQGAGNCSSAANACSLSGALGLVFAGDTIELTTPGVEGTSSSYYSGGFSIATMKTSAISPVTIEPAPGVTDPILDGGGTTCVLIVGDMHLVLKGLTIQNGSSVAGGGGISQDLGGTLSVSDSAFVHNSAPDFGDGGAIDSGDGDTGTLSVTDSTFSDNEADADGGAIDSGDDGGSGTLTVTQATFEGSNAISGGGATTVGADIFAASCNKLGGTWTDEGYNVGSDTSCFNAGTGDTSSGGSNLASLLDPLASHGGRTQTMALLAGNPAIGLIPNPTTGLCPVTADQRGDAGIAGASCDAGAVQLVAQTILFTPPTTAATGTMATLSATGGPSGNPVIFEVASSSGTGVCAVSGTDGTTVNFNAAGTCRITAAQAGNANDTAAPSVTKSISVT